MFSQNSSIEEGFNYPEKNKNFDLGGRAGRLRAGSKVCEEEDENQFSEKREDRRQKDRLYFNIRVIKHIGTFVENLKAGIVRAKPNLRASELFYLQSETKSGERQSLVAFDSPPLLVLEALVLACLWCNVWKNSYELIFSEVSAFPSLELATLTLYCLHVYFLLNSELKNERMELVSDRELILEHYVTERLPCDVLIVLALILQMTPLDQVPPAFIVLRLVMFLVLQPISQLSKKLENVISVSTDMEVLLSLAGLFLRICLLLHSLSLVLTVLSQLQKHNGETLTWVEGSGLHFESDFELYIVGWYWGATILSTVGFGDISPANHFERAFMSIVEVICCICFGYFVNYVGTLINTVGESRKNYEKGIRQLNRYLLKQQIPDALKSNIRAHFFNKHRIEQVYDPKAEEAVMEKLTHSLSSQLTETRNERVVKLSKFISTFGSGTVKRLSMVARKMVFAPEQIIFSERSRDLKVWVIEDGVVEEFPTEKNPRADKAITTYDKANEKTLGWINFLTDRPYRTTAKAKTFTLSYEINQADFLEILRESPSDYGRMCELRQSLLENKRQYINKCLACHRFTHNVMNCQRIHFVPRSIKEILKHEKKQELLKGQHLRKSNAKRGNCRLNWKAFECFTEYSPQVESIVRKCNQLRVGEADENLSRRCSVESVNYPHYDQLHSQQSDINSSHQRLSSNQHRQGFPFPPPSSLKFNLKAASRRSSNLQQQQELNSQTHSGSLDGQFFGNKRCSDSNYIGLNRQVEGRKQRRQVGPLEDPCEHSEKALFSEGQLQEFEGKAQKGRLDGDKVQSLIDRVCLKVESGFMEHQSCFAVVKKYEEFKIKAKSKLANRS